jgi:adenine-specific DNA methylase
MASPRAQPDRRLIEEWLPIAALGEESVRERRSMTALPPTYYLHVWWARRPLVASRAAVLASLLPADADRDKFLHILGIHGDPVATRRRIDAAKQRKVRFEGDAYTYKRAFTYSPDAEEVEWLASNWVGTGNAGTALPVCLDPTAGGGSIPFESVRCGVNALANDLNPVAGLILQQTVAAPLAHGYEIQSAFETFKEQFVAQREERLARFFPNEPEPNSIPTNFLWARTITCPYCAGVIPLSPNWRLASDGTGVHLVPHLGKGVGKAGRHCTFEIVTSARKQSEGTVTRGDAQCPFPDCGRVVDGDEIKKQAQAGKMGDQLFAVVFKRKVKKRTKTGRVREVWQRGYRPPRPEDDVSKVVAQRLAEKMPEWEARDIVPSENLPVGNKTVEPMRYGMATWRDLFSPRQLLGHCTAVEIYRELLAEERAKGPLSEVTKAAFGYLALALDKMLNYNAKACRWDITTGRVRAVFDRHDFAFVWSYAEMAPLVAGLGYDWAFEQTGKCIEELVELVRPDLPKPAGGGAKKSAQLTMQGEAKLPTVQVTCKSADSLDHLADGSVDAVVIDPPYYDNVMYAELSDFFYVWLKRTAGQVFPEFFRQHLTDKENEAVANPAKFRDHKGARALADRDYQQRMAAIFGECRRVLKPNGIMTVMFTHKSNDAWDALTKAMLEGGFAITASWPINTEAEGSLHQKDKAAASSTVFLVCRPRAALELAQEGVYWEDVEPLVGKAVRARIADFETAGIKGVDLYLACFGPALEEFSRHWPLKRGTPRPKPADLKRRKQQELFDEPWDPYATTPEDALDAARREVKNWRLERLTHRKARADLDPKTAWFVLAWDAFKAPEFAYDEALRLARVCGLDLDSDVVGTLAGKKASKLVLWDSSGRAAKGSLGSANGSRGMIDAIHHAAHAARTRSLDAARELLERAQVGGSVEFFTALEAVLEVLPPSKRFTGIEVEGPLGEAASDFDALEMLRRLAFQEQVDEPEQLAFLEG